jgi:hypothetical protein
MTDTSPTKFQLLHCNAIREWSVDIEASERETKLDLYLLHMLTRVRQERKGVQVDKIRASQILKLLDSRRNPQPRDAQVILHISKFILSTTLL